eukprot:scaffold1573_cov125-Isochrysis_galbana.AAC.8
MSVSVPCVTTMRSFGAVRIALLSSTRSAAVISVESFWHTARKATSSDVGGTILSTILAAAEVSPNSNA